MPRRGYGRRRPLSYLACWPDDMKIMESMDVAERGAYWSLCWHLWGRDGRMPADHARLAQVCGATPEQWATIWPRIERHFDREGDELTNYRMSRELERSKRKAAGHQQGAWLTNQKRWGKRQRPEGSLSESLSDNTPSRANEPVPMKKVVRIRPGEKPRVVTLPAHVRGECPF